MPSAYKYSPFFTDLGVALFQPSTPPSFNRIDYHDLEVPGFTITAYYDKVAEKRDDRIDEFQIALDALASISASGVDEQIITVMTNLLTSLKVSEAFVSDDHIYGACADIPRIINNHGRFNPAMIAKMNIVGRTSKDTNNDA